MNDNTNDPFSNMRLVQKALRLARQGIPVGPCDVEKTPSCSDGFYSFSTDETQVRYLFDTCRAALIGARMGAESGYITIDIDPRHNGDVWEEANADLLAGTFAYCTRSGGSHYWFKNVPGLRPSVSRIAEGVDVRAEGSYVIPWFMHGQRRIGDSMDVKELPAAILQALLDAQPRGADRDIHEAILCEGNGSAYGMSAVERERRNIIDAADGSKHAILNKAAFSIGGLVTSGDLPEDFALSQLRSAVDFIAPRCKDVQAAYRTLEQSFQQGMSRPRAVDRLDEEVLAGTVPLIDQCLAEKVAIPEVKYAFPDHLLQVDGFIGEFMEYTLATSRRPQPVAALAAALCTVSALAGRKYRSASDLWTNLYAVTIIDSGGGKDHARKVVKDIISRAGLLSYLGGEEIASGSALQTSLATHPARLFLLDEAGDQFGSMLNKRAPAHKAQIAQKLKILYTSSASLMLGIEYADQGKQGKPRVDIHNPIATIYGTTTPSQFWNAVAGASLEDGLMGRMLLFVPTDSYSMVRDPGLFDPPSGLIEAAKAIAAGTNTDPGNIGAEMIATTAASPATVPYAVVARAELAKIEDVQEDLLRKHAGTYVTSLAARIVENAIKLALLRAISASPSDPVITAECMRWGSELAMHCFNTMLSGSEKHASENTTQAHGKLVLDCVRKNGGNASARDVTRKTNMKLSKRERDEALDMLVEGGWLTMQVSQPTKGGTQTRTYSIRQPGDLSY